MRKQKEKSGLGFIASSKTLFRSVREYKKASILSLFDNSAFIVSIGFWLSNQFFNAFAHGVNGVKIQTGLFAAGQYFPTEF